MKDVANTPMNPLTEPEWTHDAEACNAAMELRTYTVNAAMNLLQIGRRLIEIKPRIKQGEWREYVEINARIGLRTAETYMQAYREFGFDGRIAELGGSQIIRMLPMSEDEREKLLSGHDVKNMSVRELDRTIKQIRAEEAEKRREAVEIEQENGKLQLAKAMERAEADKEKAVQAAEAEAKETVNKAWADARAKVEEATARANEAEKRAFEAESRPAEIVRETVPDPELVKENQMFREEIERLQEINRQMLGWSAEKAQMQKEIEEGERIIREQQDELNEQKQQIMSMKDAQKRGESASGTELTLDTFQRATREYLGYIAIMPQMKALYAGMSDSELRKWKEPAEAVLSCIRDTLQAMTTVSAKGGYSIE